MKKIINALPDLLVMTGGAAVAYGAWLLHPAAGYITGGVLLIAAGVMSVRAKAAE